MRVRRAKRFGPLALVLALTLVLAACGDGRDDDEGDGATDTTAQTGDTGDGTTDTTAAETTDLIDATDCPGDPATGVEGDTIKLGTSLPQSGLYSAFAGILRGGQAYFDYLNAQGGVDVAGTKYKIELIAKDDAYAADQTVSNVTSLVNDDQVFALFNVVGTKNNLAIRDFTNENCVPNLFAATGSPAWGNNEYPWVLGTYLVPYPLEMKALVDHLGETKPDATIAVLRANDDFGAAYAETLDSLIEGTEMSVAKVETYDPETGEVASQMTSLAATQADVFVLGATLTACPTALNELGASGWKPIVYMSGTCTSQTLMALAGANGEGVLSVAPLVDPADPANEGLEPMTVFKQEVAKSGTEGDGTNGIVAYGWTAAAMLADTLSRAPELTREAVMEAARTLEVEGIGLMVDGQSFSVGADDWFLGEQFNLVQYSTADKFFTPVGEMRDYSDQTEEITPENLING